MYRIFLLRNPFTTESFSKISWAVYPIPLVGFKKHIYLPFRILYTYQVPSSLMISLFCLSTDNGEMFHISCYVGVKKKIENRFLQPKELLLLFHWFHYSSLVRLFIKEYLFIQFSHVRI